MNTNSPAQQSPNFIVSPGGNVIPIPKGASGPKPTVKGKGFQYMGGSDGNGLNSRVTGIRIMDTTSPSGRSPGYPNGYVCYTNVSEQTVHPYTGRTINRTNPWSHIPLLSTAP